MGDEVFWFSFSDHRFYPYYELTYYPSYSPGSTLETTFEAYRPDYFIVDSGWWQQFFTKDEAGLRPYARMLHIPRSEMEGFLASRARLVASVETENYGEVRVYRISWD
jgi:hypothetical protein